MPELRRDPVIGRWIIIATDRVRRPGDFRLRPTIEEKSECPFCEGHESATTNELFAIRSPNSGKNQPGWSVRVVAGRIPILSREGEPNRHGKGMYDLMNGIGAHEVIIEAPKHVHGMSDLEPAQIEKVIETYIQRIRELEKDSRLKYVLIFKNHGVIAGPVKDVIRHTRSQLIAMPVVPKRVKEELEGARLYYQYKDRCVFCDLIREEQNKELRIVEENESFVVYCPFASVTPFEMKLLPKKHQTDFASLDRSQWSSLADILKRSLTRLSLALEDPPHNLILYSAPYRRKKRDGYWKTIDDDYHWHIEIMPRLSHVAGFEWGTGIYINPTSPEEAAELLREAL